MERALLNSFVSERGVYLKNVHLSPLSALNLAMTLQRRPFRVLGLQQVAIGGMDRSALKNLWCNELGLRHIGYFESEVRRGMCYVDAVEYSCNMNKNFRPPNLWGLKCVVAAG